MNNAELTEIRQIKVSKNSIRSSLKQDARENGEGEFESFQREKLLVVRKMYKN